MSIDIDYGSACRVGLLIPSVNRAAEPQLRAMLPMSIGLAVTRLRLRDASESSLLAMADNVETGAELLADAGVDLIVFHCTAVSTYSRDLEASILRRITSASGVKTIATSQALVESLRVLDARRLVLLSPYPQDVNAREGAYLESHGFEVLGFGGCLCPTAEDMMSVTAADWASMADATAVDSADAYVLSCTNTRAAEAAETIEAALGKPVVTSNTAVAWACMQALQMPGRIDGFGALMRQF